MEEQLQQVKEMVANMKQLFFLILVLPLLAMTPPNKEAKQRKVVEEYVHTLLNTDDEVIQSIAKKEDIVNIFPSFNFTKTYPTEETEGLVDFLLYVKRTLQGHRYKILNFKEGAKKLKKDKIIPPDSDRGNVYYIYDKDLKGVFFYASVVVDDNYKIISIAIVMCDHPQRLCFLYL